MKNLGLPGSGPGDEIPPAAPLLKIVPKDPPLKELIDEFVESRPAENTRLAYRKALDDFLSELGVETLAAFLALKTADIVRYRNALQKQKLAPATINQRLVAVRGIFSRLLKIGKIERNPADPELVGGLKTSDVSKTEGLSLSEVERMIASCDGTLAGLRDKALIMTLYYQGLRRSEASKLNYRDLVTRRGLLEVRDAKNNPYDTVRLRPEVKAAIEGYLEVLNRDLERRNTRPEDPVFVSLSRIRSFGKRLSPVSINVIVKLRAKAAEIERRVSAHGLRHTCATHGLSHGVPLHQVQRHLRHKDIRTTLRYDRERDVRKNPMTDALPPDRRVLIAVEFKPSGFAPTLLWLGALLLTAGVLILVLVPAIKCPECMGFGEVQYVHTTTAPKDTCPRCGGEERVTLRKYFLPLNPDFH